MRTALANILGFIALFLLGLSITLCGVGIFAYALYGLFTDFTIWKLIAFPLGLAVAGAVFGLGLFILTPIVASLSESKGDSP